ncbi:YveK family protein [Aquibacillus salsiterrae]|uniref:Wzz/FepE/Etk N-terminal domain-containing protein n=1 Tax=Aquibacillus salsiterrae TaxID=2950439 RepID=A0A9X3WBJ9_9BACI|nr:Wzz/FepE/Etk N-terminal domain-containing protein [Aquibacillus salsiterrae]MDC3416615.1 Wzz/FepE/Etk N-terminal domain-containing protein [Aquibacillus salsiterrae]
MEETISLKEIVDVIKKRLLLILLFVIVAAAISAVVSFFVLTPTYQSSSQFLVKQKVTAANNELNASDINTSLQLINTYNEIIKSPRILDTVSLEVGQEVVSDNVQVSSAQNSQVVTITVTDTDPEMAATIADTIVEVFKVEVPVLMNVDNVNILTDAETNRNPVNPKPMLNIAIAVVVGAMAGVGLAFLLEYLDNTVKTEADLEKTLSLPVLGVVSHINEEDVVRRKSKGSSRMNRKGSFDV